uniref:Uncharacterized protein n=1 Tax=Aegilops tauschii subsp. strangulata TaxID=200361 RepID=A0A453JC07_AEGTS
QNWRDIAPGSNSFRIGVFVPHCLCFRSIETNHRSTTSRRRDGGGEEPPEAEADAAAAAPRVAAPPPQRGPQHRAPDPRFPLPSLPDSIQSRALGLHLVADFWFGCGGADVQKEEKKVEKAIRDAAKRGDMGSAKALAKELVQSRKAVNRLYENKAQLNSISMHLGEIVGNGRRLPRIFLSR